MKNNFLYVVGILAASSLLWIGGAGYAKSGSSSDANAGTEPGAAGKPAKAYQLQDKDMTSISFTTNSAKLSKSEIQSVKSFVDREKTAGTKVDSYIVAAWSDQDYTGTKQTSGEQKLANNRAKAVEKALKDAGAKSVSTYEMTDDPSWIAKVFSTIDAELKGAGRTSTTDEKALSEIGQTLRSKGGPGKVVVIAKFKS